MSEEQSVSTVQQGTSVAPVVAQGRGHESPMSQSDFEIPRAKIVQFTSEEAQAVDVADRVQPGTFINALSKAVITPVFMPIQKYKTYTQWNPRKKDDPNYDPAFEPGEMIFTTLDRHDPRVMEGIKFGPNNEIPKVTESITVLAVFEGQKLPLLLSFSKTSFKAGKRMNTLLEEAGGDIFSNKFKLVFNLQEKSGSKYYVIDIRGAGKSSPEEFKICENWYNRFKNADVEGMAQKEQVATE